jgi:hypothetical protein
MEQANPNPTPLPSETPNVVLANPVVRRTLGWVVGVAAVVVPTAAVIDQASADLDWSSWLAPATAATSFLAGLLGLIVTVPNVPRH